MNEIIEILKILTPVLVIYGKIYIDNKVRKRRESKQQEINRKKQEEILVRMETMNITRTEHLEKLASKLIEVEEDIKDVHISVSNIEEDTKILNELHKHTRFSNTLMRKIEIESSDIMELREVTNNELRQMLKAAISKFKRSINEILMMDFSGVESKVLIESYKIKAKEIRNNINKKNLGLVNPLRFMDTLKKEIAIPLITSFALDVSKVIKEKNNGIRRKFFEKACLNLLNSIINETITVYNKEEKV